MKSSVLMDFIDFSRPEKPRSNNNKHMELECPVVCTLLSIYAYDVILSHARSLPSCAIGDSTGFS